MSTESSRILVIDDDADIAKAARLLLERHAMTVVTAADPAAAWVRLAEGPADVILLDLNFARGRTTGEEGFALLDRLIAADRHAIVIVVTGHSGIAVAVQAMRSGATDFVIKPWHNERLLATVERGLALRRAKLNAAGPPTTSETILLGESPAIARIRDLIARVAPSAAPALVSGPGGSGKSLIARMIHQASAQSDGPFVILEAESADTKAIAEKLETAAGGTILIDHVDRLPRALHGDLARRLEGVRPVATTRLDPATLRAAVSEDLLFRLNTIEIDVPPLADRGDDAILLARHFLAVFAHRHAKPVLAIDSDAAQAIAQGGWTDDVRGLRLAMERAALLGESVLLGRDDAANRSDPTTPAPVDRSLAGNEQALVTAALQRHAFNVSRAAAELGLTRAALYRRMARYGL